MKVAVIYATLGRAPIMHLAVARMFDQTDPPDAIIVSACREEDVAGMDRSDPRLKVIFSPAGMTAQRNAGLALVDASFDVVVFFDDDFVASRYWLAGVKAIFAAYQDVAVVTGAVLKDGIKTPGLEWDYGAAIVDHADERATGPGAPETAALINGKTPYGCNMAYRRAAIHGLAFDTRLVLYSWQEDRDFGAQVVARGWRMIESHAVWGVHLGAKRGRVSGIKFGYSQMVNPWYLNSKGTMRYGAAGALMLRNLMSNVVGAVMPEPYVDRAGRLKGNLIGIRDIVRGVWRPERASEL